MDVAEDIRGDILLTRFGVARDMERLQIPDPRITAAVFCGYVEYAGCS